MSVIIGILAVCGLIFLLCGGWAILITMLGIVVTAGSAVIILLLPVLGIIFLVYLLYKFINRKKKEP